MFKTSLGYSTVNCISVASRKRSQRSTLGCSLWWGDKAPRAQPSQANSGYSLFPLMGRYSGGKNSRNSRSRSSTWPSASITGKGLRIEIPHDAADNFHVHQLAVALCPSTTALRMASTQCESKTRIYPTRSFHTSLALLHLPISLLAVDMQQQDSHSYRQAGRADCPLRTRNSAEYRKCRATVCRDFDAPSPDRALRFQDRRQASQASRLGLLAVRR